MFREETIKTVRAAVRDRYRGSGYGSFYFIVREQLCPFFEVEEEVPRAGTIIDIGCGYGLMANILAAMSSDREVLGVDKAAYRIAKAQASTGNAERVTFVCEDIREVELVNCAGITMIDFLHHIPFSLQEEILDKCAALLEAGGRVVIKEFADRPRWKYWATVLFEAIFYPKDKLTYRPIPEWQSLLEQRGFAVTLRVAGAGSFVPSVILVAEKR